MTNLRDLLELLYLARTRWKTARFAMDDWTHLDRQQDAYERSLGLEGSSPPHSYGEIAAASRTWIAADGRFRQERERMTLVHDGTRTWIATPESGVIEHESRTTRPIGEEFRGRAGRVRSTSFPTARTRSRSPSTASSA